MRADRVGRPHRPAGRRPRLPQRLAGHDAATLASGIRLARRIAGTRAMDGLLEEEVEPSSGPGDDEILSYVRRTVGGYWHPVGTCRMGPPSDANAVVDPTGRLHGGTNVWVADASIMPAIPRANPQILVLAVAERIRRSAALALLLGSGVFRVTGRSLTFASRVL
jgi:choline dehydrogenase